MHLVLFSDKDLKPSCVRLELKVDLWRVLMPRGAGQVVWMLSYSLLLVGPSHMAPARIVRSYQACPSGLFL